MVTLLFICLVLALLLGLPGQLRIIKFAPDMSQKVVAYLALVCLSVGIGLASYVFIWQ